VTPPPALLVVGHGTSDEAGADGFRSFVQMLGERNPGLPVGGGISGADCPALTDAVTDLVEKREARQIAVIPLTLGRVDRADQEIRAALGREEARYADTPYAETSYAYWSGPLGPHPALLSVLERRLDQALGDGHRTPSDRAGVTVLLVGRGSSEPESNAELYRVARLLWEGRGYASVEVAFVSGTAPDVPSGLDRCAKLGGGVPGRTGRIVVLPYFLFDGVLPGRARQQAEGWSEANAKVDVTFADVIGAAPELADLVMERYAQLPPARREDGRAATDG
jgi:sirohydrochlorin cobaltochelatase